MGRIPPDRTGYLVYACIGISRYVIDPIDCMGNLYKQLPPLATGPISDFPWLNMDAVADDVRLHAMVMACNVDFDPFEGTAIDLYRAFLDDGLGGYIEDLCYTDLLPRYATGYSRAKPMFNLTGACGRD